MCAAFASPFFVNGILRSIVVAELRFTETGELPSIETLAEPEALSRRLTTPIAKPVTCTTAFFPAATDCLIEPPEAFASETTVQPAE